MSGASRTTKSHACSYSCRSAEFISHIAICEGENGYYRSVFGGWDLV